jgi:hypothetical protein
LLEIVAQVTTDHKNLIEKGHISTHGRSWTSGNDVTEDGLRKAGFLLHDWCENNLPEYKQSFENRGSKKSEPITFRQILAVGRPELDSEMVEDVLEDALHQLKFEKRYTVSFNGAEQVTNVSGVG